VYEIRTYGIKTGGLQHTMDLWQEYLPPRSALSPCLVAMFALQGRCALPISGPRQRGRTQPHPWRSGGRRHLAAQGWPAWLTDMHSTIRPAHRGVAAGKQTGNKKGTCYVSFFIERSLSLALPPSHTIPNYRNSTFQSTLISNRFQVIRH
jgi:hypothetical protein